MTILTADFERGTNGSTIAAADPGSANAFDSAGLGGSGSVLQYVNTPVAHGSLAAHLKNATSGSTNLVWSTSFGTQTESWGRMYVRRVSSVSSNFLIFGGGKAVQLASTGVLTISGGGSTTTALPLNQWARVEWHYVADATAGSVQVRLFVTNPDGSTPDEDKLLFSGNTSASITSVDFGNSGSGGVALECYLDQLVGSANAYPGPFPVSTIAPTVAGSTVVGAILSCDGGTWNTPLSLSYQWTRDGTNISAATSQTYTTVTADVGHAVACTVTATGQQATNETASQASSNSITVSAAGSAPVNTVAPAITGTPNVGLALSTSNGTWTDDGSPTFTYHWQRDNSGGGSYSNITSATSSTYTLVAADDGCHVRCVVTDSTPDGNTSANSNAVSVTYPAPTNIAAPVASGTTVVGQLVTCTVGSWEPA